MRTLAMIFDHHHLPLLRGVKKARIIVRRRNDLLMGLGATGLTAIMSVLAAQAFVPAWETSVFRTINNLPDFIYGGIWIFMQYGVFATIPVAALVALYFRQKRLAIMLILGGLGIYFGALVLKDIVSRGRPPDVISGVIAREQFRYLSLGFTSGHTAVAATIATFAHRYLPRFWQIVSLVSLAVVAFGRIYIGGHFPLDVLAGITLGVAFASFINYIFGVPKQHVEIKSKHAVGLTKLIRIHRPRHPGDIVRLVVGVLVFVIATMLAMTGSVSLIEEYLFRLINYLPAFLWPAIETVMQMGALLFVPVAALIALLYKHPRLAIKISSGGVGVWLLAKLAKSLVHRDRPFYILNEIVQRAQNSGILGFPSGHAAVAALLATVSSAYMKKSWSRLAWLMVWTVAVARVYVGAHLPLDVIAGVAMGWALGSALNLLFGTPDKPLPRRAMLATLKLAGYRVKKIVAAHVDARGSSPLIAELADGNKMFVKLVNNEHRNADMLFKFWRYFTLREVEDEAPFTTAKHLVEHEAYMYHQALGAGVKVPKILLAAPVTSNAAILVSSQIQGATLDKYEHRFTDQLLERIWKEVLKLRRARIAHRDLRAANIFIDKHRRAWIIDFSFAESAASERHLTIDIVEMLASLSFYEKPKKVVQTAIDVLSKKVVGATLPYLQLAALSSVTRHKYKARKYLLEEVRQEVEKQTRSQPIPGVKIKRFGYHTMVWLVMGVLLVSFIFSQAGNVGEYVGAFKSFNQAWMFAAFGASVATYLVSTLVILGASRQALAYGRTLILQLATTFINRITPKSLGGIAVTERYLENSGLSRPEAMATISLSYFTGVIVHLGLMGLVLLAFARHPVSVDMPEGWSLIFVFVAVLLIAGLGFIPKLQRVFKTYLKQGYENLRHTISRPIKIGQLFGGSLGVTLAYTLALYFSMLAFGISLPFEQVLLVYLAGSVIASAAPTPGGLGAAEAALAGGLIALGVNAGPAITSVLAFRFLTYWLPILPGFFGFRYLHKQHLL